MRVLLAGESWISNSTHYKGFDSFSSTTFETGADHFIAAAASQGITVEQLYAHDVPGRFPRTVEALSAYDVVILSDIGYNSFVLPNEVIASRFSMELKPEFYFAVNGGRYPMGAHAWWTVQPKFWAPCIPPLAAIL